MPQFVRITDVAPRDGLQNEPGSIPAARKAELVRSLIAAKVDEVEVSSFVSKAWIPQLGDAAEVFSLIQNDKPEGIVFSALVPNDKGLAAAIEVNQRAGKQLIDKISVFTAASETFSRKNTNASIEETLQRFVKVVTPAKVAGLRVRGYISCVIACPFEGPLAPDKTINVARRLLQLGIDELDYGDTIGAATPHTLRSLLEAHISALGESHLSDSSAFTLHLHDTFGRASECALEALSMGVRSFDAAAGGLGGCPYASTPGKRAPGNLDTQLLVNTLQTSGYTCGVDTAKLSNAADFARSLKTPGIQP